MIRAYPQQKKKTFNCSRARGLSVDPFKDFTLCHSKFHTSNFSLELEIFTEICRAQPFPGSLPRTIKGLSEPKQSKLGIFPYLSSKIECPPLYAMSGFIRRFHTERRPTLVYAHKSTTIQSGDRA
eukprot:6987883-Prymnesium_polylepis.2